MKRRRTATRAAFSLIEAAIVLGVVGLVIGGIWVAASTVNAKYKASQTGDGAITIIRAIQNKISRTASNTMAAGNMTSTIAQMIPMPPGYTTNGTTITSPMGTSIIITNMNNRFDFDINGLNPAQCLSVLSALRTALKSDIKSVHVFYVWNGCHWTGGCPGLVYDVTQIPTAANCPHATNNIIDPVTYYMN